ncbi:MAG TPA: M48 family metallopeptidase [Pyrinomonadaceae bacterium]|jgi:Zn-dependent protease with chaperone function|nr:M48 family metallopeptidase [Pyrinomonadaceae bacterium]
MKNNQRQPRRAFVAWLMTIAILVAPSAAFAQTRISYHSNRFSVSDDVKLGQQAAAEAEQQFPILRDEEATYYVEQVGRRLVNAIPPQFQHPEFRYYFKIVNARDINAFALPGGPMYVNRGMIEAAHSEGEMAGVMAHELSHVALRHGTAQATKAQKYQYGAIAGAILGSIIGGGLGQVVGQGSQMAIGAYFLKYSREYETEADVLGAQIMARAGYDPRDLANMFRTIEQQGSGRGGPEWLSSHPNPGRRYERINQEAAMLRVNNNPTQDTAQFRRIQERLRGQGRAPSMEEIARSGQRYPQGEGGSPSYGGTVGRVQYPSSRYRTYTGGNLFRVSYPDNWRELPGQNSIWFAPEGGYGQNTFTHGVTIGIEQAQSNNLRQATDAYISRLIQSSRSLRQQSGYQRGSIDRHSALSMTLSNINEATGQREVVTVYTTLLSNGQLFYMISVAPQRDYGSFQGAFNRVLNSIQLND